MICNNFGLRDWGQKSAASQPENRGRQHVPAVVQPAVAFGRGPEIYGCAIESEFGITPLAPFRNKRSGRLARAASVAPVIRLSCS